MIQKKEIQVTYIKVTGVLRKGKVSTANQCFMIEVCSHVVRDRRYVGSKGVCVALKVAFVLKKLEFDHVTIHTKNRNVRCSKNV